MSITPGFGVNYTAPGGYVAWCLDRCGYDASWRASEPDADEWEERERCALHAMENWQAAVSPEDHDIEEFRWGLFRAQRWWNSLTWHERMGMPRLAWLGDDEGESL